MKNLKEIIEAVQNNNEIYSIVRDGIYRHAVGGIFDSEEKAISNAIKMMEKEDDRYHEVIVLKFNLNILVSDGELICTVKGRNGNENVDVVYSD